ncbi:MAG: adenylate/guanylate cyclase domain-containing protein [Pseudomonadota bacterium]
MAGVTSDTESGGAQTTDDLSFKAEELAAQWTALRGRLMALCVIAVLISVVTPWPGPLFYFPLLLAFALLGWSAYYVEARPWRKPWHMYAFATADFALLAFTLQYPNPLLPIDVPPHFTLRYGGFVYFFVLLAGLAYLYRPGLVLWGGIAGAISWAAGIFLLVSHPGVVTRPAGNTMADLLALQSNPLFVDIDARIQEAMVLLITASLLALAVNRARSIALRQANLASEKTNLARYFPRKTVELLATKSAPLSKPREHKAAVLFADLVAFTSWAEERPPQEIISVLRQIHGRLAETVFRHEGTIDKFIGDGVMATFGTPEPTPRDAVNALKAAVEMADEFDAWKRTPAGQAVRPLDLAIGVHYGPIVIGDVGSHRRMEFAVLGDTVNVASRLEQANREIGSRCIISGDLVDAAMAESPDETEAAIARLQRHGPISLRGRSAETEILMLPVVA